MIPILYNSQLYKEVNGETAEITFDNGGIGWLKDCIKCTVTEELNGSYECEFSYPITGQHYSQITPDRIIKVKPNETSNLQLFRIYRQSKPINGVVKFYCQHISYDLNTNMVTPFKITSNTNVTSVLTDILEHCYYAHRFTAVSQSGYSCKFDVKIPVSARKCIGGMEGSILDRVHGEFEFDNFIIRHYASRGQNNGVVIQYGKNLTDITADTSIADTYTSIYPYATDEDGDYYELTEKVIELQSNTNYGEPRTLPIDLSSKFDSETRITETLLRQYANEYINNNSIDEIKQNIKISFVQLWQAKEYETIALLERVALGDTVTVKYPALGVSVQAKVIKTVYDVLAEKYIEIEVGQAKSNFANTLNKVQSEFQTMSDFMRNQPSLMEKAAKNATDLITGQTGGYIIFRNFTDIFDSQGNKIRTETLPQGQPAEMLIMDNPDITQALHVWRYNLSGWGYSSHGVNGPFALAATSDGAIVADFITTGVLNADLIRTGTIKDVQNNTSINLANGKIDIALGSCGLEIWTQGITMYNSQSEVLTSMFVSANGKGVLTANTALIGTRDSEKVRIDGISGEIQLINTDTVNHTVSGKFYLNSSNKSVLQTDFVNVNGIQISKNSNGRLAVNQPIVSNFSIEDSNGNEIGSFYGSSSNNSVLNSNYVYTDTLQSKTANASINVSSPLATNDITATSLTTNTVTTNTVATNTVATGKVGLVTNGNEVGSFYINTNGESIVKANFLMLNNHFYTEQAVTINGTTYNLLVRT